MNLKYEHEYAGGALLRIKDFSFFHHSPGFRGLCAQKKNLPNIFPRGFGGEACVAANVRTGMKKRSKMWI